MAKIDYSKLPPIKRLGPDDCYNCGKTQKPLKHGLCNDCNDGYLETAEEESRKENPSGIGPIRF